MYQAINRKSTFSGPILLAQDFPTEINSSRSAWSPCQLQIFLFVLGPSNYTHTFCSHRNASEISFVARLAFVCNCQTDASVGFNQNYKFSVKVSVILSTSYLLGKISRILAIKYLNYLWHIKFGNTQALYTFSRTLTKSGVKMTSYK